MARFLIIYAERDKKLPRFWRRRGTNVCDISANLGVIIYSDLDVVGRYNEVLLDGNWERFISVSAQDNTWEFMGIAIHIIVEPVDDWVCLNFGGDFAGYSTMVGIMEDVITSTIAFHTTYAIKKYIKQKRTHNRTLKHTTINNRQSLPSSLTLTRWHLSCKWLAITWREFIDKPYVWSFAMSKPCVIRSNAFDKSLATVPTKHPSSTTWRQHPVNQTPLKSCWFTGLQFFLRRLPFLTNVAYFSKVHIWRENISLNEPIENITRETYLSSQIVSRILPEAHQIQLLCRISIGRCSMWRSRVKYRWILSSHMGQYVVVWEFWFDVMYVSIQHPQR